MTTNLQVEEVAVTLFALDWPTSVWGETGLEPTYRRKAQAVWERIHAQRAGEPPTPDEVERAAKAMQAIGHDRWRGSAWEAGMGWRTLAWDEVRDDEKRFVRELARAALDAARQEGTEQ